MGNWVRCLVVWYFIRNMNGRAYIKRAKSVCIMWSQFSKYRIHTYTHPAHIWWEIHQNSEFPLDSGVFQRFLNYFCLSVRLCCLYCRGGSSCDGAGLLLRWPPHCGHRLSPGMQLRQLQRWLGLSVHVGSFPSGVRPASPALTGGLSTTEPPGKPLVNAFWCFANCHQFVCRFIKLSQNFQLTVRCICPYRKIKSVFWTV